MQKSILMCNTVIIVLFTQNLNSEFIYHHFHTMFIYNVTIQIEWDIHEAWLKWMMDVHIPQMLGTGCFQQYQLVRLLEIDESAGPTYAVQYYAESKSNYNRYMELFAPAIRKRSVDMWGDK